MNVAQVTIQRQGDLVGVELPDDIRTRMNLKVGQVNLATGALSEDGFATWLHLLAQPSADDADL